MSALDLDAAKQARQEAEDERQVVVFGGTKYELPAVAPASVVIAFGEMVKGDAAALRDALAGLFGEEHVAAILRNGFDLADLKELCGVLYGMDVGELPASGG